MAQALTTTLPKFQCLEALAAAETAMVMMQNTTKTVEEAQRKGRDEAIIIERRTTGATSSEIGSLSEVKTGVRDALATIIAVRQIADQALGAMSSALEKMEIAPLEERDVTVLHLAGALEKVRARQAQHEELKNALKTQKTIVASTLDTFVQLGRNLGHNYDALCSYSENGATAPSRFYQATRLLQTRPYETLKKDVNAAKSESCSIQMESDTGAIKVKAKETFERQEALQEGALKRIQDAFPMPDVTSTAISTYAAVFREVESAMSQNRVEAALNVVGRCEINLDRIIIQHRLTRCMTDPLSTEKDKFKKLLEDHREKREMILNQARKVIGALQRLTLDASPAALKAPQAWTIEAHKELWGRITQPTISFKGINTLESLGIDITAILNPYRESMRGIQDKFTRATAMIITMEEHTRLTMTTLAALED